MEVVIPPGGIPPGGVLSWTHENVMRCEKPFTDLQLEHRCLEDGSVKEQFVLSA
jgi:hypothetical protein